MARRGASFLTPGYLPPMAEKVLTPRMFSKPIAKNTGKEWRKRHPPRGSLRPRPLLFANQHRACFEIDIGDQSPKHFRSSCPCVSGEADHRVDPAMFSVIQDVPKQLADLALGQVEAVPQL